MLQRLPRTRARGAILSVLQDAAVPLRVEQIAALSGASLINTTNNVDRLIEALYVHSPREFVYELTPEGRVYCHHLIGR